MIHTKIMSREGSDNSCSICLEPLACAELRVGAVVPCGHCLHIPCFEQWRASRLQSHGGNRVKCPMCNSVSSGFVRLFMDFGTASIEDDASDDSSLSSNEEEQEHVEDTNNDGDGDPSDNDEANIANNDAREVIVIDDDDDGATASSAPKPASAVAGNKEKKYKRRAKQLKRRVAQLQADKEQQGNEKCNLIKKMNAQKEELECLEQELEEATYLREGHQRTVEGLKLQVTQFKRELTETSKKLATVQLTSDQLQKQLDQLEARYRQKFERASAASMKEVQQLLQERPKIVAENRELKEKVRKYKNRLASAMKTSAVTDRSLDAAAVPPPKENRPRNQRSSEASRETKKMLRTLDQANDPRKRPQSADQDPVSAVPRKIKSAAAAVAANRRAVASTNEPSARRKDDPESGDRAASKLSSHAARMSRATSNKPAARPSSALAALNAADHMEGEPVAVSEFSSFFLPAAPKKRKPSTFR